ncbi:MAG: hypothetical protein ACRDD1_07430, partial [Planctomycetia bacterium]
PVGATDDETYIRRLGAALEQSPWLCDARVARGFRATTIDASYRRPVLFVPRGGRSGCYVDGAARVLPADDVAPAALRQCLTLDGVVGDLPLAVGRPIDDARIRAASGLANRLESLRSDAGFSVFHATVDAAGRVALDVRTNGGSVVRWGVWNPADPVEAALVEAKIDRLRRYVDRFGGLDYPAGPYLFDLVDADAPFPLKTVGRSSLQTTTFERR